MDASESRLDGNAVGGVLAEIFATEMTASLGTCAGCGATEPVGALHAYVRAPGVVVRCPHCSSVMIRIVRDEKDRVWLDIRGVSCLEIRRAED
ncbi:MAG: hypothetical protein E6G67_01390 [Actinobacteria bacterium]|nr:MAG: hypothetical protein E6G67_01390 [Actinomycetota bacterium]